MRSYTEPGARSVPRDSSFGANTNTTGEIPDHVLEAIIAKWLVPCLVKEFLSDTRAASPILRNAHTIRALKLLCELPKADRR